MPPSSSDGSATTVPAAVVDVTSAPLLVLLDVLGAGGSGADMGAEGGAAAVAAMVGLLCWLAAHTGAAVVFQTACVGWTVTSAVGSPKERVTHTTMVWSKQQQ